MQRQSELTDRTALLRNRLRAHSMGKPANFLQRNAVIEIQERLALVNRTFTDPAIVTGWPEIWANALPNAVIVKDEATLDLTPGTHDLVIHAMALHWADDPVGQLIQCRRALRPDGLFLGSLFGGQTLFELRAVLAEAEAAVTGGLSPRIAPMAEIRDLGALLQRAGYALPVADSQMQNVSYANVMHLMRDLRAMGESNALNARTKLFTRRSILTDASLRYADAFSTDDRINASFEIIYLTGWNPDASQPQALRPGSAKTRLADVLGVQESPLSVHKDTGSD